MTNSVGVYNKKKTSTKKSPLLKAEKFKQPMFDIPFFISVLLILAVGLIMLYSTGFAASFFKNNGNSYLFISKQVKFAGLGLVIMIVASIVPEWVSKKFYYSAIFGFYILAIVLLIAVFALCPDPEKRWIPVAGSQFQPSELGKVAVVMLLAWYISKYKDEMDNFLKGLVFPAIIFLLPCALIFEEPHLSGALVVAGIGYVMLFTGGSKKWLPLLIGLLLLLIAAVFLLDYAIAHGNNLMLKEYQAKRFKVWHDPTVDLLDAGFQPYQSLITIGSGGAFGLGYGKSRQKYLYLPEPQNDYIFSVIAEELGFVGVVLIMLLFIFLIWRGIYIGIRARNTFESMVVIGIMSKIAIQTLLNFAVVSNSIPSTGISLPFFSSGGTALIVQLAEMGRVLHASRYAYLDKGKKDKKE